MGERIKRAITKLQTHFASPTLEGETWRSFRWGIEGVPRAEEEKANRNVFFFSAVDKGGKRLRVSIEGGFDVDGFDD
jgi:hypothetical protein